MLNDLHLAKHSETDTNFQFPLDLKHSSTQGSAICACIISPMTYIKTEKKIFIVINGF